MWWIITPPNLRVSGKTTISRAAIGRFKELAWVEDCTVLMPEHGRYLAAVFV